MNSNKTYYYLNGETKMLFAQQLEPKPVMIGIKLAKVEGVELNHVKVTFMNGQTKWFKLLFPSNDSLVEMVEAVDQKAPFDDFDLYIQCEEVYHE
jgi:hypothetical protein